MHNKIFYRIITNGSLPRDKRLGYTSPFDSPKSPSKNQPHFSFDTGKQWGGASSYENVSVQHAKITFQNGNSPVSRKDQSAQVESHSRVVPAGPPRAHSTGGSRNFSGSSISRGDNYENVIIGDRGNGGRTDRAENYTKVDDDTKGSLSTYGTIRTVLNGTKSEPKQQAAQNGSASIYENIVLSPARNNSQNHSMPKKNGQLSNSCEMIENKLAISNDDLLEAIEQLSMLSKSKDVCVTPKRNNSEKDNAKSNEAKADKERKQLEEEDRKKYIEFLQNEKLHILGNMDVLKRNVAEIEIQEEEINREVTALILGCFSKQYRAD